MRYARTRFTHEVGEARVEFVQRERLKEVWRNHQWRPLALDAIRYADAILRRAMADFAFHGADCTTDRYFQRFAAKVGDDFR